MIYQALSSFTGFSNWITLEGITFIVFVNDRATDPLFLVEKSKTMKYQDYKNQSLISVKILSPRDFVTHVLN